MPSISSKCSGPAMSGGESWMTGSPRSSARQMSPRRNSSPERKLAQQPLGLVVVEGLLRALVLDELDRVEVARAAHVADDRDVAQRVEHRAERRLVVADVLDDALVLHHVDVRQRDRAAIGWPANVKPCMNDVVAGHERLGDPVRGDHGAERRVGRGDALRRRDDVRLVVVALGAEPLAEPAPRADDLVGDHQHVVSRRRSRARAGSSRPAG